MSEAGNWGTVGTAFRVKGLEQGRQVVVTRAKGRPFHAIFIRMTGGKRCEVMPRNAPDMGYRPVEVDFHNVKASGPPPAPPTPPPEVSSDSTPEAPESPPTVAAVTPPAQPEPAPGEQEAAPQALSEPPPEAQEPGAQDPPAFPPGSPCLPPESPAPLPPASTPSARAGAAESA